MTLSVDNLILHQGEQPLFGPLSFSVAKGEIFTLMGPSGCGKSTLLSAIAGHIARPFQVTGNVMLNDIPMLPLTPNARKIGLLFQDDLLFPHLTVVENLMFGLPKHYRGNERRMHAMHTLDMLGLSALRNNLPQALSGGQRARISVMRMLLSEPHAVLLDEPFSKLDKALRTAFRQFVFDQIRTRQIPAIMVTHDDDDVPPQGRVLHWPWPSLPSDPALEPLSC
ncbi:ATP-binding cassette domain-containing protein [Photobacterium japonica]|uniref:ATP-binding cassette domain-containing protein n=1 Tax=Photobacterium japonica TaxID=2910235 RepID=UPI003D11ECBF